MQDWNPALVKEGGVVQDWNPALLKEGVWCRIGILRSDGILRSVRERSLNVPEKRRRPGSARFQSCTARPNEVSKASRGAHDSNRASRAPTKRGLDPGRCRTAGLFRSAVLEVGVEGGQAAGGARCRQTCCQRVLPFAVRPAAAVASEPAVHSVEDGTEPFAQSRHGRSLPRARRPPVTDG